MRLDDLYVSNVKTANILEIVDSNVAGNGRQTKNL